LMCSCTVGPDYKRPDVTSLTPAEWRWKVAEPRDALPRGEWWRVFGDPVLDELEAGATANNQNLYAAMARVDEARAIARLSHSQFFPELSLDPSFRRERTTANLPTPIPVKIPSAHINTLSLPLDLSYEVDLWGRVRRSFEAAQAQAGESVADYQNVLLTLTADVAVNYFMLRSLDSEIAALRRTVGLHNESVRILSERFAVGSVAEIVVAGARAELANVKAELSDLTRRRAETLNALALLCGKHAGSLEIAESPLTSSPPVVPAGLPSSLLERRPDIARAERALAARNAQIGVAVAGYFPALRLTGQAGYLSRNADSLFSGDSHVWSLGPGVSLPLFTAGRTTAEVKQAEASYQRTLAEYRQTVLAAFKDVEDSLAQIVLRKEQASAQDEACASAGRVAELTSARYEAGAVSFLELADAQRKALFQSRVRAQLEGLRFAAAVRLIKALGGGWEGETNE
ncbi:MAG TPA: efflux transporter outer membrane subunit, partial [Thermodesulfovibrionales bacterium]|nr:efflux transporter outer membrane subunit [Thermodesulfovibrionales bacterium]